LRSRPDNNPSINAPACRSGSHRANRGAIRSNSAPNPSDQRSGSILAAAASAAFVVVFTTTDDHALAAPTRDNTPNTANYGC